jgi:hypothetical protein
MEHKNHIRISNLLNLLVGIWLIATPFVMKFTYLTSPMWNDIIFGAIIAVFAIIKIYSPMRALSLSWLNAIIGLWLILSPLFINYPDLNSQWSNVISGVLVVIFGTFSVMETNKISNVMSSR